MSRKITGSAEVFPMSVTSTSTTQEFPLGAKAVGEAGKEYRYVEVGAAALTAGQMVMSPASVANHVNIAVQAAVAVGATSITVTLGATAATANQYADGVIAINDVDGQGHTYVIDSHPAADASANLTVTLKEEVREALTTSSQATLHADPHKDVLTTTAPATGTPIGVAVTDAAANTYAWVQNRGVAAVLNEGGTTAGLALQTSGSDAGALATADADSSRVGVAVVTGVDTEYNPVFLTLQ